MTVDGRALRRLTGAVAVALAAGAVVVVPPVHDGEAIAACVAVAANEEQAKEVAAACRQPVVVESSRTEFSEVTALPDGRLQFSSSVVPQRTRQPDGWADVDLRLMRGDDGLWRPTASIADVAFSDGGSGPLVALTRGGGTVALSWPEALPTPTVSGDSVTYPNVMTDVDLVVRATWTGFTHVLVVKTPEAARNPAVREFRFKLGGDAEVLPGPGGSLRAQVGTGIIASTEHAVMWDSRVGVAPSSMARRQGVMADESGSSAVAAGDAARVADVDVELSDGDLVLRPDVGLLDAPEAVYPLYVDPAWSVYRNKWAYATSNGSSNSDTSRARVGKNPGTGALYRSYFQFPTTANGVTLKGKHVESARVEMRLDHSYDCEPTVTSMYSTSAINATPKASWSTMKLKSLAGTASGNANEAGGCGKIQPDITMNFTGASVTDLVQDAATGRWSTLTVGFTARASNGSGESVQGRWKKFYPNLAKLVVDYDTKPGVPHSLQVAGVACGSGVLTVGTLAPTLSAVFPDADSGDSLTGRFEWIQVPSGGIGTVTDTYPGRKSPPPVRTGITPNSRATSSALSIAKGSTYAFRAKGTDRPPYSLSGDWSGWCRFAADTTVPPAPTVTPGDIGGPGREMTFTFATATTDVTKFRYGWSDPPALEVLATGSGTKTATVTLSVPSFGQSTLWVRGIDATGNLGNLGSATFTAPRPSPPVAKWGLEQYPGVDQDAALADQQPTLAGETDLDVTNVSWSDDARLVGGKSADFDGDTSFASTSGPVIDPTASFAIAAWVKLGEAGDPLPARNQVVVTQDGSENSSFSLGYRSGVEKWNLWMHRDDAPGSAETGSVTSGVPVMAGVWTHLAGVFDAAGQTTSLYVNGELSGTASVSGLQKWPDRQRIAIGRELWQGGPGGFLQGQIADVQVFDRVLVSDDFVGRLASDPLSGGFHEPGILTPIQVGGWDFEAATPCYTADLKDTCEAPDTVTAWGRWLALNRGSAVGAGQSAIGSGLWLDDEYFPEEGFAETTQEYGRSAVKVGTTPPDDDGLEFTQWQDQAVLKTNQSFTMSAWVMLDRLEGMRTVVSQRGTHESAGWIKFDSTSGKWRFAISKEDSNTTATASVDSTSLAEAGVWTHLSAVYDAGRSEIRIYVNGVLEGTTEGIPFTPMASTGPLLVGHTLWRSELMDQWTGGIDNVELFQGAMTATSVTMLYNSHVPPVAGTNTLTRGEFLTANQYLRSDAGNYRLTMQGDGNLVLTQAGAPLWDSETWDYPGAELLFQLDGNVVVNAGDGTPVWDTETWDTAAEELILRDDGDLVLLDRDGEILWRR